MTRRLWCFVLCGLALLLGCDKGGGGSGSGAAATGSSAGGGAKKLRIAVIPKGTTHEFWKSVHAGAVKASRELDVEIVWKGPLKEDDLKQQVELVQSFTAQRVGGIVLAPLNDKALVKAVKDAVRSKVPVVIFDSGIQENHHIAFVATDNKKAGRMAGEEMAKLTEGKGRVVVLRYQEGSASTANREEGFLEAAKEKGLTVMSDNQYGGATTESAFAASESLLIAQRANKGGVDGIFCPNESTTFGMLVALQKLQLAGKVKFIGFDASDKLVQGLKDGHLSGLVLQDPFTMGYLAVQTMVSHVRGANVAPQVDTGSTFVTSGNMTDPNIKKLLEPELGKWLNE